MSGSFVRKPMVRVSILLLNLAFLAFAIAKADWFLICLSFVGACFGITQFGADFALRLLDRLQAAPKASLQSHASDANFKSFETGISSPATGQTL